MKRISEKVRDLVEVRPYIAVDDLFREPDATLSNYRFTDITAFMMSGWFDAVASKDPRQMCRAIAGFRGVGKSHFLAAFALLLSHPELRSRSADQHVQSSLHQLLRRHYPVVNVRRGSGPSLLRELQTAAIHQFDLKPEKVGTTIAEAVAVIAECSSGLTPILIIDSNPERNGPIERNDGNDLAEVAECCRSRSVFVGIALDDEISMADGSNSAISKSFNIEYLDPENLHKIVDTYIFPKNPRNQVLLGSLYNGFREAIPDFNWSEQRFSALYPLHPILLELTPFIRSYLPKFALFGFASTAGERILGRPADSLIGIDDVFDAVEFDLRKVPELNAVFAAYDSVSSQIGQNVPVAARHKAKLVLKVLLLNSLAQRPSSGADVAAAMMISDNGEPGNSIRDIDSMLSGYAASLPNAISVDTTDSLRSRYKFNICSNEFEKRLNLLIESTEPAAVDRIYLNAVGERFPEIGPILTGENESTVLFAEWRGSRRPGRIFRTNHVPAGDAVEARIDWEVALDLFNTGPEGGKSDFTGTRVEWKVGLLSDHEKRSLAAHAALTKDAELRTKYPDEFSATALATANAVSAAVERTIVNDARLVIDGFDFNFSDMARQAASLSQMIGEMLEPLFEAIHFEHPYFVETLTPEIVERFIKSLSEGEDHDQAALTFGVALGVAEFGESGFALLSKERLRKAAYVSAALDLIERSEKQAETTITAIEGRLAEPPGGLTIDAVRIILTAMAHRGLIELVTADHERINGRSIDLKLQWSNIIAAALPGTVKISDEKLLEWARLVCGDESIVSLSGAEGRTKILEAFVEITAQWERRDPFRAFESVPDTDLNTNMWRHSNKTWESYSATVANVNEALLGNITIEECIDAICSSFASRPELFHRSRESITAIEEFGKARPEIDRIGNYLAVADATRDPEVESARESLREALLKVAKLPSEQGLRELGYCWEKFLRVYTEHYTQLHSRVSAPLDFRAFVQGTLGEGASAGDVGQQRWQELSLDVPPSQKRTIKRRLDRFNCSIDPEPFLQKAPFCKCGFQPSDASFVDDRDRQHADQLSANATLLDVPSN